MSLPEHASYILQPLDVSAFSSFKDAIRRLFKDLSRTVSVIDAFDIANIRNMALQESHTIKNIRSGFHRTGIWNVEKWRPSAAGLEGFVEQF